MNSAGPNRLFNSAVSAFRYEAITVMVSTLDILIRRDGTVDPRRPLGSEVWTLESCLEVRCQPMHVSVIVELFWFEQ
jgi:hypothetical protein